MTIEQLEFGRHNSCPSYGDPPAGERTSEANSAVRAGTSFWPIGMVCDWPRADGKDGTVPSHVGDYQLTIATYVTLAASVAAGLAAIYIKPRRRSRST